MSCINSSKSSAAWTSLTRSLRGLPEQTPEEKITEIKKKTAELEKKIETATSEFTKLNEEKGKLKDDHADSKTKKSKQFEVNQKRNELRDLKKELRTLKSQVEELTPEEKTAKIEKQLETVKLEIIALNEDCDKLRKHKKDNKDAIYDKEREIEKKKAESNRLQKQLKSQVEKPKVEEPKPENWHDKQKRERQEIRAERAKQQVLEDEEKLARNEAKCAHLNETHSSEARTATHEDLIACEVSGNDQYAMLDKKVLDKMQREMDKADNKVEKERIRIFFTDEFLRDTVGIKRPIDSLGLSMNELKSIVSDPYFDFSLCENQKLVQDLKPIWDAYNKYIHSGCPMPHEKEQFEKERFEKEQPETKQFEKKQPETKRRPPRPRARVSYLKETENISKFPRFVPIDDDEYKDKAKILVDLSEFKHPKRMGVKNWMIRNEGEEAFNCKCEIFDYEQDSRFIIAMFDNDTDIEGVFESSKYVKLDGVTINFIRYDEETDAVLRNPSKHAVIVRNFDRSLEISQIYEAFENFGKIACVRCLNFFGEDMTKSFEVVSSNTMISDNASDNGVIIFFYDEKAKDQVMTNVKDASINGMPIRLSLYGSRVEYMERTTRLFMSMYDGSYNSAYGHIYGNILDDICSSSLEGFE